MQVIDQEKTCHIFETSEHHDLDNFTMMENMFMNALKTIEFDPNQEDSSCRCPSRVKQVPPFNYVQYLMTLCMIVHRDNLDFAITFHKVFSTLISRMHFLRNSSCRTEAFFLR